MAGQVRIQRGHDSDVYCFSSGSEGNMVWEIERHLFCFMKGSAGMLLAVLLGIGTLAIQNAKAGSAVAMGDKAPYLVSSYGYLKRIAEQRALEKCKANGGNCRIIVSTERLGYGAVAAGK